MLRFAVLGMVLAIVFGCGGGGGTVLVIDVDGPLSIITDPPIVRANTSTKFIAFGLGFSPGQFDWRTGVFSERMTSNGVYSPGSSLGDELIIAYVPNEAVIQRTARTIPSVVSIVFASDSTGQSEIWSIDEDGTRLAQRTTTGGAEPVGCTAGERYYFRKGQELWVTAYIGGIENTAVFDTFSSEIQPLEVKHSFTGIDWLSTHHVTWRETPAGGPIQFHFVQNENTYLLSTAEEIDSFDTRNHRYVLSIRSGSVRQLYVWTSAIGLNQLTFGTLDCIDPSNGLDGRSIYFAGFDGIQWDIYALDQSSHVVKNLTRTPAINEEHPSLSPEGKRLVFSRGTPGTREVWTMKTDGKDKRSLVTGLGDCVHPDYTILSLPNP